MFSPPVYISIGDEYDKRAEVPLVDPANKPKPFVVSAKRHPHITDSVLGGFAGLSGGESYDIAARRQSAANEKRGADQPPFRPAGAAHKSSGKGDYYGTFSEKNPPKHEPEFPPIERKKLDDEAGSPKRHTNRLIYTNPSKKGTYGYTGLTIQQKGEIQYVSDPYDGHLRHEALEKKESNNRHMGAPFRAAVRSGGCFDETEHGFPKVYSLTKPLPLKKTASQKEQRQIGAKPWIPGGALTKEITQYPEYQEDPWDEKERKVLELRRAEREHKAWKPVGNDPYRYIYTKPIQYNPPPVK